MWGQKDGNNPTGKYVKNIKVHTDQQIIDIKHYIDEKLKGNNHFKENNDVTSNNDN